MRHLACGVQALQPGGKRAVVLAGRRIVVVRAPDGSYHALADTCPHQGARLSGGFLGGVVVERAGAPAIERGGEVLRCPWHNYAFDIRTGRSLLEPDRYRVRVYQVAIEDGGVLVEIPE
jgi:nitrite reductase/ring-hydroxylating ferredoxin subunit